MTVVQSYYGLLAAQTRTVNAERAYNEGQHFLDLSRKLEEGGEVAHSDTIKAQIQANDLKRGLGGIEAGESRMHGLSLAVLLFPNFFQDFTLVNDLSTMPALPPMNELQAMAAKNNPELEAAFAALAVANKQVNVGTRGIFAFAFSGHVLRHRRQPVRQRTHPAESRTSATQEPPR